jgi:hypothetical protein
MTLDLANLPADLIEAAPDSDHASEPANDPACELALEASPLPAESSNPIPQAASALSPLPQELPILSRETPAVYPSDHFVHALYGGFMGMPDLPGALLRAELWEDFIETYTNPEFSHHFAHIVFPAA